MPTWRMPAYSSAPSSAATPISAMPSAMPARSRLSLGLPVHTFDKYSEKVRKQAIGTHVVPNLARRLDKNAAPFIEVEVRDALVTHQPLGAFYDSALRKNLFSSMKNQTNLIIDVGFFTLDWLVASGIKIVGRRSDGIEGGMSLILETIAEDIKKDTGEDVRSSMSRIDEGLRGIQPFAMFGKPFDLKPYLGLGAFKELQDPGYFNQVGILFGAITWPHEQDIAPETLLAEMVPLTQTA